MTTRTAISRIRVCRESDLRALEWDGLFTHHREIFERTFREQRAGRQVMLVADVDGAPKAQSWIDVHTARDRGAGIIWGVRVHPALQNRGLGTTLLEASERVIRERGLAAAELVVESDNTSARRLYERMGYRTIRSLTQTYSYTTPEGTACEHCLDLIQMRKELSA